MALSSVKACVLYRNSTEDAKQYGAIDGSGIEA